MRSNLKLSLVFLVVLLVALSGILGTIGWARHTIGW
jgi:hypothetical protein